MSYFKQSQFSTSSVSEEPTRVEKGHKNTLKVDLEKIDDLCKNFRDKQDYKISKLSGMDKEHFDEMVSYVQLLHGTSFYEHLYEKVKKYFGNIRTVKPGTVGAYFAGCMVTSKNSDEMSPGCSISCAGSMPLPKDEDGWSFCDKAVIMAEKGSVGYDFSVVKPAHSEEEMEPAYLFVDSKSLHDFSGFSKEEKDQIRAYGCKSVKLVGYGTDMTYSDLYKEPKKIHEIKHRHHRHSKKSDSNTGLIIGVIIFAIILLLLLCVLGYKYYRM